MKLAVIFGGKSTEHEVSIISGISIIKNLDKERYDVKPTYIDEQGNWYQLNIERIDFKMGERPEKHNKIENVLEYLKEFDLIFPVLHGKNGEDGTIQGLFEIIGVPYVGCGVLSSSLGMDKAYTKMIFEKANLKQAPYVYIRKHKDNFIIIDEKMNEEQLGIQEVCKKVSQNLKYPVFVKPSNAGSSVGINKVKALIKPLVGLPKLYVFSNCVNMIREFKSYFWGNDDNPVKRDDHAMDELRYYVCAMQKKMRAEEKSRVARDKERLYRRLRRGRV